MCFQNYSNLPTRSHKIPDLGFKGTNLIGMSLFEQAYTLDLSDCYVSLHQPNSKYGQEGHCSGMLSFGILNSDLFRLQCVRFSMDTDCRRVRTVPSTHNFYSRQSRFKHQICIDLEVQVLLCLRQESKQDNLIGFNPLLILMNYSRVVQVLAVGTIYHTRDYDWKIFNHVNRVYFLL